MKVIAWTVNTKKRMKQLIINGTDGIVTDYPEILSSL
jgi:glycerophosphoryl diester phosphodiesterase